MKNFLEDCSFQVKNEELLAENGLKVLKLQIPDPNYYKYYKLDMQSVICSTEIDVSDVKFYDVNVDIIDRHPIEISLKVPSKVNRTETKRRFSDWFKQLVCSSTHVEPS